ncbi:MAG: FAD:protein FMN transferase [Clostridia bacterium]|nr:FAD:protein FMN transferase [Clostridia bacterium]
MPDEAALSGALSTINYNAAVVSETTVTVPSGTMIDLGGIAKGYVADKLASVIRSNGVTDAIIYLGGNIYCVGDKAGEGFHIGVQSPFSPDSNELYAMLTVSDTSVVTAGTYQRGFEIGDEYYHHILDLSTGYPASNGLVSVTIITDSSTAADALSTICLLKGAEEGMALVESIYGVEAVMITSDGDVLLSSGAKKICEIL